MKRISLSIAATTILLFAAGARPALAGEHILVVLDVTGSMSASSSGGMTRMQVAKQRISTFLAAARPPDTEYALWFFEDNTFTEIFDFSDHATAIDVNMAVQGAAPGGSTPLAHSVCAAVDELIGYKPAELHIKRIYLATDGEENNTPNTDQCFGPYSAANYPNLTIGSWQWKVRNKACTGNANTPGVCDAFPPNGGGFSLIVDIDHLFDFIPALSRAASLVREGGKSTHGTLSGATLAAVSADQAFFTGLAAETHGRYQPVTPATPPAQATPIPGDANLNGCVNIQDRALVLQHFGTPGNGNTDFNRDGIVNTFDLQTVLQNFGAGCS